MKAKVRSNCFKCAFMFIQCLCRQSSTGVTHGPIYAHACTVLPALYCFLWGKGISTCWKQSGAESRPGALGAYCCPPWMAGNPGVQNNSNIQLLFLIRKYFLIITAGVLWRFTINFCEPNRRDEAQLLNSCSLCSLCDQYKQTGLPRTP